jgi:hypothetical protein
MKDLHTEMGSGQGKTFLESASKQANVLSAEEYFVQVDFAMAEFTIPKYPLHKFDPASNRRDFFASGRSCNWKRFVFEYLSREQGSTTCTNCNQIYSITTKLHRFRISYD